MSSWFSKTFTQVWVVLRCRFRQLFQSLQRSFTRKLFCTRSNILVLTNNCLHSVKSIVCCHIVILSINYRSYYHFISKLRFALCSYWIRLVELRVINKTRTTILSYITVKISIEKKNHKSGLTFTYVTRYKVDEKSGELPQHH